jgi:hypothetical protein
VAGGLLSQQLAIGTGRDLQIEDVWGLAFIEDEEDLSKVPLASGGFNVNDPVDARFEEGKVFVGHWSGRSNTMQRL